MSPKTLEKESPTRGYSSNQPAEAIVDEATLAAAVEAFQRDGYFIARGLMSPVEVEDLNTTFMKMHADGGVPGHYDPKTALANDSAVKEKVENDPLLKYPRVLHPHRFNEKARRYLTHPKVVAYLERFMGHEPVATQSMYYFKPPGSRGQAIHQDNFYLLVQPGTCCAAWTALDDCDPENGGLMVVPNTQNMELVCPEKANPDESYTVERVPIPQGQRPVHADMKAGDTLFFNGNVLHGSGPNRSKTRFRRSFICHYAKGDLERISKFYTPVVGMDGRDIMVNSDPRGGPCGSEWQGAPGA